MIEVLRASAQNKVKLTEHNCLIVALKVLKCRGMSHIIRRKLTDEHVASNLFLGKQAGNSHCSFQKSQIRCKMNMTTTMAFQLTLGMDILQLVSFFNSRTHQT